MYLYYRIRSLLSPIFFIITYNLPHFQCRLSVSAPLKRLNQLFTPRRYEVFTLYLSETIMTFPSHGSIATKSDTEIPLPSPVFLQPVSYTYLDVYKRQYIYSIWSCNQLVNLLLCLSTKGAVNHWHISIVIFSCHRFTSLHPSNMAKWRRRFGGTISLVYSFSFAALRLSTISSIKPYAFASSALMKLSRSVSSAILSLIHI